MKKLNSLAVERRLEEGNLRIFRPRDLQVIFGVNRRAVEGFLHYNTKKGIFEKLRPGLYALVRKRPTDFYLANRIYAPSYVSLDTALSYHGLIPESVYSVISVTPKSTREFEVGGRSFSYRQIKKAAYTGYRPTEVLGETVNLATPEKALADFLYFVYLGKRSPNDRLDWTRVNWSDLEKYVKLFGKKGLAVLTRKMGGR